MTLDRPEQELHQLALEMRCPLQIFTPDKTAPNTQHTARHLWRYRPAFLSNLHNRALPVDSGHLGSWRARFESCHHNGVYCVAEELPQSFYITLEIWKRTNFPREGEIILVIRVVDSRT